MHNIGSSERPDWPVAVVVGAGGLGMAVARRLGQSHRLLIADRDAVHLEQQIARLKDEGHDAAGAVCDVTRGEDIADLTERAASLGPVRTLAYVVGLSPSAADFRAIMSVNLIGAAATAASFRTIMAPGGCGVFISSSAAHMQPVPEATYEILATALQPDFLSKLEAELGEKATPPYAYSLAKAGLNRMCQREAWTWGAKRLRIVSLSPGLIATPMGALEFVKSPSKHRLLAAVPLERECSMLEIANVVEFLVSDRASFISGTDILVDGGMIGTLRHPAPQE